MVLHVVIVIHEQAFRKDFAEPIEAGQCRDASQQRLARSQEAAKTLWLTLSPHVLQRTKADVNATAAARKSVQYFAISHHIYVCVLVRFLFKQHSAIV
jgi:hypothetical protein